MIPARSTIPLQKVDAGSPVMGRARQTLPARGRTKVADRGMTCDETLQNGHVPQNSGKVLVDDRRASPETNERKDFRRRTRAD